jgi:polyisoprenoid-binding protein YceI
MESDKFPKSTFKGKIKDLSKVDFNKDGEYAVTVAGSLTIKDKTNEIEVPGTIIVKDGKITAKSKFKVRPEDYNVNIPALVKDKIAKEIDINVDAILELYKK